ncbi:putative elongator complex protein 1, partial [Cryomyces antarcticus]
MRNLKNLYRSVIGIPPGGLPLTATAWDATSDSLICAFGPSKSSAVIELRRVNSDVYDLDESNVIASWDAPCPLPGLQLDKVLNLHFFADIATACLVLAGGDIVIVREEPLSGEDSIEIVGSVDAGITAASWSPDEELLAISTRASTLLFMTREFENVTNVAFTPEDIKASKHVSVGWGKAETQFKGKRAKALRDPTMPDHVDEGNLSSLDNGVTTISWRGDGAFLAVNTVENEQRRMIRVYSREGTLDSVSEPVDGLEGALSWRPAGNLIAGVQRLEERIDIVFFERNGLRHGQFSLRITPEDMKTFASVVELKWNSDSTVLAVCFLDKTQLWTIGNYHYYLKQEIRTGDKQSMESVVSSSWHPEKPLKLALSTK